jgi:recombination protein RecT
MTMSASALRTAVTGKSSATMTDKPNDIFGFLRVHQGEIARALPKHMSADRMARIATTEVRRVPKLLACDAKSLFGAIIQASQLGLEPGGGLGHSYLVPYGKECQLIIGYRGMIDLARRSGQMISLSGEAVFAKDRFEYELGLDPKLKHVPSTEAERGPLVYAYAIAHLVGGGVQFVVLPRAEVDRIRSRSSASSSGPWKTDYDAMAIKTAIRRLFKYLPVSIELQRAVVLDEAADRGAQNLGAVLDGDFTTSPTDDAPGEESDGTLMAGGMPALTFAKVADSIHNATTADGLALARDLIRSVPKDQRAELSKLADDRAAAIDPS